MCNEPELKEETTLPTTTMSFDLTDPAAVAAAEQAKARIQLAFFMADRRPRDVMTARSKILEACKRSRFAEQAVYEKPVGGKTVRGPSIRFAEQALREWKNVDIDTAVIFEDSTLRRIRVTCTDLETNTSFGKEIVVEKTVERKNGQGRDIISERVNSYGQPVFIVKATEEEMRAKEARFISMAIRNEGLRLIPGDIIDEGLAMAWRTKANEDQQDPLGQLKRLCDSFMEFGIEPRMIAEFLGHPIQVVSPEEVTRLRAIYVAVKSGEVTWSDIVEVPEGIDPITKTRSRIDELTADIIQEGSDQETPVDQD